MSPNLNKSCCEGTLAASKLGKCERAAGTGHLLDFLTCSAHIALAELSSQDMPQVISVS